MPLKGHPCAEERQSDRARRAMTHAAGAPQVCLALPLWCARANRGGLPLNTLVLPQI